MFKKGKIKSKKRYEKDLGDLKVSVLLEVIDEEGNIHFGLDGGDYLEMKPQERGPSGYRTLDGAQQGDGVLFEAKDWKGISVIMEVYLERLYKRTWY